MRINEVLSKDPLSEIDIGRGLGKVIGKTAKFVGGVAGGAIGAVDAARTGYHAGRQFVRGQGVGQYSDPYYARDYYQHRHHDRPYYNKQTRKYYVPPGWVEQPPPTQAKDLPPGVIPGGKETTDASEIILKSLNLLDARQLNVIQQLLTKLANTPVPETPPASKSPPTAPAKPTSEGIGSPKKTNQAELPTLNFQQLVHFISNLDLETVKTVLAKMSVVPDATKQNQFGSYKVTGREPPPITTGIKGPKPQPLTKPAVKQKPKSTPRVKRKTAQASPMTPPTNDTEFKPFNLQDYTQESIEVYSKFLGKHI